MTTSNFLNTDVLHQIIARLTFWETSQRSQSGTRGVGGTLRVLAVLQDFAKILPLVERL